MFSTGKAFWDVDGLMLNLFSVNLHPFAVFNQFGGILNTLQSVGIWVNHLWNETGRTGKTGWFGSLIWGPVQIAVFNSLSLSNLVTLKGININGVSNFTELTDRLNVSVWNESKLTIWSGTVWGTYWEVLNSVISIALFQS